jgi:glutaminase
VAALPAQLGLGTFSPPLDDHGNSVRGLKICEALSRHFGLHMLNRSGDVRTSIIADYDIGGISSRRSRLPRDQQILEEHREEVRVIELVGAHSFATVDYVSRRVAERPAPLLIIDFHRVASITTAADQVIFRNGGNVVDKNSSHLKEQALLAGLSDDELASLAVLGAGRTYRAGQRIVAADEPGASLFFLQSGMVSVKLPSGVRLASLDQGMEFGEMALLDGRRTADVWADTDVSCLELPIEEFDRFRREHPQIGERIARNLAAILARRLTYANAKIDLLTAY